MRKSRLYPSLLLILLLPVCAHAKVWGAHALVVSGQSASIPANQLMPGGQPVLNGQPVQVPTLQAPDAAAIAKPAQPAVAAITVSLAEPKFQSAFEHDPPRRVAPFPLTLNQTVRRYIDSFLNQPDFLEASFNRVAPYLPDMVRELDARGLPRDLVYLAFAESEFSKEGAGPWQLTKSTARRFGLHIDRYVDERRDPVKSTRAAAEFLAGLHDEIGDWRVTVASWNRGEASIDRFWALRGKDYSRLITKLPRCTRTLLNRFMAVAFIAHNAEAYGFDPIEYSRPPFYRMEVRGGTPLSSVAEVMGTSVQTLRGLNPALLRDKVPPSIATYELWVPRVPDDLAQDWGEY
jgi:membrane-bound lytic murein transglycosylase D